MLAMLVGGHRIHIPFINNWWQIAHYAPISAEKKLTELEEQ